MSTKATLKFTQEFGEREAYEAEARGYLGIAVVELDGETEVAVVFYDPVRLQQDLEDEASRGRPFIADPGMIILQSVTLVNMHDAIEQLSKTDHFQRFTPAR